MTTIITMPDIGIRSVEFDPVQTRFVDRMDGRRSEELVLPTTWWQARYQVDWADRRDFGRLDAFMMLAAGGAVFRAWDPERPRPMAHDNGKPLTGTRAGGGAFTGTATLAAITSPIAVTVSGLPAGFQLRQGDYVEFRMSATIVSLHRIVADATANGSGIVALAIRFPLDTQTFTTAATVNFEKPSCLMKLDQASWRGVKSMRDRRPSFAAAEYFP